MTIGLVAAEVEADLSGLKSLLMADERCEYDGFKLNRPTSPELPSDDVDELDAARMAESVFGVGLAWVWVFESGSDERAGEEASVRGGGAEGRFQAGEEGCGMGLFDNVDGANVLEVMTSVMAGRATSRGGLTTALPLPLSRRGAATALLEPGAGTGLEVDEAAGRTQPNIRLILEGGGAGAAGFLTGVSATRAFFGDGSIESFTGGSWSLVLRCRACRSRASTRVLSISLLGQLCPRISEGESLHAPIARLLFRSDPLLITEPRDHPHRIPRFRGGRGRAKGTASSPADKPTRHRLDLALLGPQVPFCPKDLFKPFPVRDAPCLGPGTDIVRLAHVGPLGALAFGLGCTVPRAGEGNIGRCLADAAKSRHRP